MNDHWSARALCAEVGGDLFYPERGEDTAKAKDICRACEVRLPCLAYSLEIGDREGIFGGFTEHNRRRIAVQHRAGKPLEDVIAEDDAAFYGKAEKSEELARAASLRRLAAERARRAAAETAQGRAA